VQKAKRALVNLWLDPDGGMVRITDVLSNHRSKRKKPFVQDLRLAKTVHFLQVDSSAGEMVTSVCEHVLKK